MNFEHKRINKIINKIKEEKLPIIFNHIINFKNGNSLISITCDQGHTTDTVSIDNFLKRGRCPSCSMLTKGKSTLKTQDEYKNIILENIIINKKHYTYVEFEYFKTKKDSKVKFNCIKHDINFSMSIDNFLSGKGCTKCGHDRMVESKVKSLDEHIQKFVNLHGEKYSYDKFIWVNNHTNTTITCKVHNYDFQKTPANFRRKVEHCPLCNGEVDINTLPTQVYVQSITKDGLTFGKFGISLDTHRRMLQQRWLSGAEHQVLTTITCDSRVAAQKLERLLKESIPSGFVDSSVLPDGHTETFDAQYLDTVLEIVNSFNSQQED